MKNENNIARNINEYRVIYQPDHHRAMTNENWKGFVYEHIVVAEEMLGRPLDEDEVVHHLNGDRANNRKENLLVLLRSQHAKLHVWLNSGAPGAERLRENGENSLKASFEPATICKCCGKTLQLKQLNYCSNSCSHLSSRRVVRPSKEQLAAELAGTSVLALSKKYGISDNAVRKWMKSYGLKKSTMSRASTTVEEGAETSGEV